MRFECELSLPEGFRVGHATRAEAETGCTVVICPPGTRGGVDVRGGGTGTRELEPLAPLANAEGPSAVLLSGGSAFGLAAADGVVRWLEQRGVGRPTPIGVVPLVPTAVVFDASAGELAATEIVTVDTSDRIEEVARLMTEHQCAHMVVVSPPSGDPVGLISSLDVARGLSLSRQLDL